MTAALPIELRKLMVAEDQINILLFFFFQTSDVLICNISFKPTNSSKIIVINLFLLDERSNNFDSIFLKFQFYRITD